MDLLSRRGLFLAGAGLLVPVEELVMSGRGRWVDDARTIVDQLHAGYGSRDVAATARTAGAHLRALASMDHTRVPPRAMRELLATQARVGALRARALVDSGDGHGARETLTTATGRATRAQDSTTVAYAFATLATLEVRDREPAAALRAVAAGLTFGGDDPRLYAAGARAHAARGELDDAGRALRIAERLLDERHAPVVAPAAPGAMSRLEFARVAVDVYTRTGGVDRAQRLADETVDAVPRELRDDTELALGASVAVGLAMLDVERGADTLRQCLEVSAGMGRPARPVIERVTTFAASAADARHPAVRDLVDLLEVLDV